MLADALLSPQPAVDTWQRGGCHQLQMWTHGQQRMHHQARHAHLGYQAHSRFVNTTISGVVAADHARKGLKHL
jgi:hypothetical protein